MSEAATQVSVVVPTRDRWRLAAAAVESALGQEGTALEVCLVDDGSATPAPEELGRDPRVRIHRHEESRGVAASRNRGVSMADSPWVAFLDDDDIWARDHLRRLLAAAEETDASWAFSGYIHTTLSRAPLYVGPPPAVGTDPVRHFLHVNPVGTPSCALVATELLRRVGGFDETLSVMADWELWVRLAEVAGAPAVSPAFSVGYAQHRGAMSLDVDRVEAERRTIAGRHAAKLGELGIEFADNEYFWRWLGRGYAANRRRLGALRYFLRAARSGGGARDLVRAVAVVPVAGWPVRGARRIATAVRSRRGRGAPLPEPQAWLGSLAETSSQRCGVRSTPSP